MTARNAPPHVGAGLPQGPHTGSRTESLRLTLDSDGWICEARRVPSPNCDARPAGVAPELLVIHNISLPPGVFGGDAIERLFTNRLHGDPHPFFATLCDVRVSSHFLIRRDGELVQFVSCADRAWHAGASSFNGRARCNDFSIGIELEGTDFVAFTEAQHAALAALTDALRARLPLNAVRGHAEIAADRKTDPGPFFAWARYVADARLPPSWR